MEEKNLSDSVAKYEVAEKHHFAGNTPSFLMGWENRRLVSPYEFGDFISYYLGSDDWRFEGKKVSSRRTLYTFLSIPAADSDAERGDTPVHYMDIRVRVKCSE